MERNSVNFRWLVTNKTGFLNGILDENAVNLVYALVGLQDTYELEDFEVKRQGALNALIACAPRKAAPYVTTLIHHCSSIS